MLLGNRFHLSLCLPVSGCWMDYWTVQPLVLLTDNGWSNTEVFNKYMQEHLVKFLPQRSAESYVLVMYDGHRSHVSLGLIEWARKNFIVLFVLPPHCSHLLQPLDVSCFGPMETAWNAACHNHLRESGGTV